MIELKLGDARTDSTTALRVYIPNDRKSVELAAIVDKSPSATVRLTPGGAERLAVALNNSGEPPADVDVFTNYRGSVVVRVGSTSVELDTGSRSILYTALLVAG